MRPPNCLRIGLLAALLALAHAAPAPACPNCSKAVAAQDKEQVGNVAAGYSRSVLLMIAMPFTLLGIGTVAVVRVARRGGIPQL